MIITRTPFRVSFAGGGTDYPAWYREHGGAVLTSSISRYCYLTARWLPPFFDHRHRVSWSKVELVSEASEIEHPAVRAAMQYLGITEGVEIHHQADLPARTGLGSSSAFTVGLLAALYGLQGLMASKAMLAAQAVHIERDLMGETVGVQDQIECAWGGLNMVEIEPDGAWHVVPVVLKPERRSELERSLLLYFTGISRHASKIAEDQVNSMQEHVAAMRDIAAMVPEALECLTGRADLREFGRILDEGFQAKKSLSRKVSTPEIDAMYAKARQAGAVGGKLLGAGGGGFLLLYAPVDAQGSVRRALAGALEVPFRFESGGARVVYAEGA